jgi:3-phenylpropionate/trans-cinnamate dioxygenase ferredoxin reductase subunit
MNTTKYLIVGAGMTGDMAANGIRDHDPDGPITMIGADSNPPYKRPLLTKGLWQGAPEEKLWRKPAEGVELVTGRRVVSLDPDAHRATNDAGEEYEWEKLLLATGARPRQIPGAEGVVWFRTLDDYRHVREVAGEGAHVAVIVGRLHRLRARGRARRGRFPRHDALPRARDRLQALPGRTLRLCHGLLP